MCEECGSTAHKTEDTEACRQTIKCALCGMCHEWHMRSSKRHSFLPKPHGDTKFDDLSDQIVNVVLDTFDIQNPDDCPLADATAQVGQLLKAEFVELDEKNNHLAYQNLEWADTSVKWMEKYKKAMRALESLTPSGSEFVDDPERCVAFAREARSSLMRVLVQTKKDLHVIEGQLKRAIAGLEEINQNGMGEEAKIADETLDEMKKIKEKMNGPSEVDSHL